MKHAANLFQLASASTSQSASSSVASHEDSTNHLSQNSNKTIIGVTYAEFVAEYVRMSRFKALKAIQARFKEVDTDGDGIISRSELHATLKLQLGEVEADRCIDTVYSEMAAGSTSGIIDIKALWNYYRNKSKQIMDQEAEYEAEAAAAM